MKRSESSDLSLDVLMTENKRLSKDLESAKQLIQLLENMRHCLTQFNDKCVCLQTTDIKKQFRRYDSEYQQLITSLDTTNGEESEDVLDIKPEINPQNHVIECQPIDPTDNRLPIEVKQEVTDPGYNDHSLDVPTLQQTSSSSKSWLIGGQNPNEFVVTEVAKNSLGFRGTVQPLYKGIGRCSKFLIRL